MTIDTQEVVEIVRKVESKALETLHSPALISLIKVYSYMLIQELQERGDKELEEMREYQRRKHE